MSFLRRRPRMVGTTLGGFYLVLALFTSDLGHVEVAVAGEARCPTPRGDGLHVLQGNLWMLPARPLLMPYSFSADRVERLQRFLTIVKACEPQVVLLQEVFEVELLDVLRDHLPAYTLVASGNSDVTGTLNASGLVTLTRLPVREPTFREFSPLPRGSKAIESLARKGFLAVRLDAGDLRATIVNLHLYAYRDRDEAAIAHAQLGEVVDFARAEARAGRAVLVGGDFNIPGNELEGLLPRGWTLSSHGPTYDPARNPYTVRGSNNTPGNHEDRRNGTGSRTIDFLLTVPGVPLQVRSEVLERPLLSDHQFLHHTVGLAAPDPELVSLRGTDAPPHRARRQGIPPGSPARAPDGRRSRRTGAAPCRTSGSCSSSSRSPPAAWQRRRRPPMSS